MNKIDFCSKLAAFETFPAMARETIDLTNCDLEPIHIPGKIQSHGFLVVTSSDGIIRFMSENSQTFIPASYPGGLGQPIGHLLPQLGHYVAEEDRTINPIKIQLGEKQFNLVISHTDQYRLFEFEPAAELSPDGGHKMIANAIPDLLATSNLEKLLRLAAEQVKTIIGYDRVMIYRFAPDAHGEVVAEAKNDNLEPWLGLHYPASDIPKQARELYKINLVRLIADVNTEPSPIGGIAGGETTIDLTWSQLRAVSPIHIQYLKNMGVASSFSISLLYRKELWGLIACHNYTPKFIDYESREATKLIGQVVSGILEFRQDEEDQQLQTVLFAKTDELAGNLHSASSITAALFAHPDDLLQVANAGGVALVYENKISTAGETPSSGVIEQIVEWLARKNEELYYSDNFPEILAAVKPYQAIASGIMAVTLSRELKEYIIWWKPEIARDIKWAGNPEKAVAADADGMLKISPRHSFDTWIQTVSGFSQAWVPEEKKAAMRLRAEILNAINVKASATRVLNERLKQAYDELDTFSYTISHDLKTPLTAIKGYAQLIAGDESIGKESKLLLQRITGRADRMNNMIEEVLDYSRIGRATVQFKPVNTTAIIKEIVQDLRQVYAHAKTEIIIGNCPSVKGDAVMLWQVFSNIISNAVKYSQHATKPAVSIEGKVVEHQVIYTVKDNGIGIPQKEINSIFLLFRRMNNAGNIEGTGVGLAIVKRIIEKHGGSIWAESEEGKGATFFVSLNQH